MSSSDQAALAAKVAQYNWFHSIDLGDGVVTKGTKTPEVHALELPAFFDPVDLHGRSVIDIGAWNGIYSFEAKRRGAARVLAPINMSGCTRNSAGAKPLSWRARRWGSTSKRWKSMPWS